VFPGQFSGHGDLSRGQGVERVSPPPPCRGDVDALGAVLLGEHAQVRQVHADALAHALAQRRVARVAVPHVHACG